MGLRGDEITFMLYLSFINEEIMDNKKESTLDRFFRTLDPYITAMLCAVFFIFFGIIIWCIANWIST